jgi:tetratricopeptide (TPR) repeat protein
MKATQEWDWATAEREFRLAISLNPSYATAHHWYAMSCLIPIGRLDDALREITEAQTLDPVSSIIARDLATIHLYRGDLDAALEECDHTVELNPYFSAAYWTLGLVQEQRQERRLAGAEEAREDRDRQGRLDHVTRAAGAWRGRARRALPGPCRARCGGRRTSRPRAAG